MSMKAHIRTDALGNITVHMEGGLNFETCEPLKDELEYLTKENPTCNVTIDMGSLDFVGSSGIGHFVRTIQELNEKKTKIFLSNVKSEFLRVFKLYDFDAVGLLIQEFEDDDSDGLGPMYGNRKTKFQN